MSFSNSGIKEMSSSNVGKSFAGGKEGFGTQDKKAIELKAPVITFADIKDEYKKDCFELALEAFSNLFFFNSSKKNQEKVNFSISKEWLNSSKMKWI